LLMYTDVCWYPCWSGWNCFENGELHRNADPLVPSLCLLLPCLILSHLVSFFPCLLVLNFAQSLSDPKIQEAHVLVQDAVCMNASWMLCGSLMFLGQFQDLRNLNQS
jgi:hypothetical protein